MTQRLIAITIWCLLVEHSLPLDHRVCVGSSIDWWLIESRVHRAGPSILCHIAVLDTFGRLMIGHIFIVVLTIAVIAHCIRVIHRILGLDHIRIRLRTYLHN